MPILHSDSQSAIMLAKNPVFHAKTKHIEVKYRFLCQVLEDKRLELVKVHIDHNPADFLTKSLPSDKFAHCREMVPHCTYIHLLTCLLKGTLAFKWEVAGVKAKVAARPSNSLTLIHVYTLYSFF